LKAVANFYVTFFSFLQHRSEKREKGKVPFPP